LNVGIYSGTGGTTGIASGVYGTSHSTAGVYGQSGASFVSAPAKTGVFGYAAQDSASLLGTIAAGSPSAVVTPGVPVGDGTRILVTLHGDPGGTTVLKRVSKNTAAGTFKVVLTANSANPCAFSWFLIG